MFLCDKCHREYTGRRDDHHRFERSYGKCEGCRLGANCADCHCPPREAAPLTREEQLRRLREEFIREARDVT